jgi:hypothetical protein
MDLEIRRKESLNKVKEAWSTIIKKYSSLPHDKQGDIVNLTTGEIVKDTGHLRSLKQKRDNLWAQHPHADQIEKLRYRQKSLNNSLFNNNSSSLSSSLSSLSSSSNNIINLDENSNFDIDKASYIAIKSANYSTLPGDINYIVSSSQHMTRSKVIGDDNLIFKSKNNTNNNNNNNNKFKKRSGLLDSYSTIDPLNLLTQTPMLDTPSKVRRLRKAMDKPAYRRNIHKLIVKSKRNKF